MGDETPTSGRVVRYHFTQGGVLKDRPAMVIDVNDGGTLNLHVFYNHGKDDRGHHNGQETSVSAFDVNNPAGHTWSWPKR